MVAFIADGNSHGIGVNVETDKGDDGSINLFLFFMWKAELILEFKKFGLVRWKVAIVLAVKFDVTQAGKRAVVVNIAFEVWNSLKI
jgi:hypothetical protein